jgi:hypothetical protein
VGLVPTFPPGFFRLVVNLAPTLFHRLSQHEEYRRCQLVLAVGWHLRPGNLTHRAGADVRLGSPADTCLLPGSHLLRALHDPTALDAMVTAEFTPTLSGAERHTPRRTQHSLQCARGTRSYRGAHPFDRTCVPQSQRPDIRTSPDPNLARSLLVLLMLHHHRHSLAGTANPRPLGGTVQVGALPPPVVARPPSRFALSAVAMIARCRANQFHVGFRGVP